MKGPLAIMANGVSCRTMACIREQSEIIRRAERKENVEEKEDVKKKRVKVARRKSRRGIK